MNKILTMLGTSAVGLGVLFAGAEARTVSYEINGQRYTYESTSPGEVAQARRRIEAANAADAAKAKAAAEKASNPLVNVFGSQAQREATAAELRLQQILSEQDEAANRKRQRVAREAPRKKQAQEQAEKAAPDEQDNRQADLNREQTQPEAVTKTASIQPSTVSETERKKTQPTLKSVFFDVETGIKTTFMTDGSIHEEPFDTSSLSTIAPAGGTTAQAKPKAAPEDVTGSTRTKPAR